MVSFRSGPGKPGIGHKQSVGEGKSSPSTWIRGAGPRVAIANVHVARPRERKVRCASLRRADAFEFELTFPREQRPLRYCGGIAKTAGAPKGTEPRHPEQYLHAASRSRGLPNGLPVTIHATTK